MIMTETSVGGPHLKGMIKHARASGYTFESAIGDVADGSITQKDSKHCKITSLNNIDNNNIVNSIIISDNNKLGFHNILDSGVNSPMNWTHETNDHDNSESVSEYGLGWKSGGVNLGDKMTLYTKCDDEKGVKYFMVILDWNQMKTKNSPECYNPTIIPITMTHYNNYHPFDNGSSIVIESLNRALVPKDKISFEYRLEQYIKRVYAHFLCNITIEVNGKRVIPYTNPLNKIDYPHPIIEYKIWILWNSSNIDYNIITAKKSKKGKYNSFKKFSISQRVTFTSKYLIEKITPIEFDELSKQANTISELYFSGTSTYGYDLKEPKNGTIHIRRDKRYITDPTIYTNSNREETIRDARYSFNRIKNNGEYNYHYLELYYKDKKINRLLGQEFTKRLGPNFPDNLLTYTLSKVETLIRGASSGLGNATSWKNKWNTKYEIEFDTKKEYHINLELGITNKKRLEKEKETKYPGIDDIMGSFQSTKFDDKIKNNDIKRDNNLDKRDSIKQNIDIISNGDPEVINEDPEVINEDPEVINEDPEVINEDPEVINKDPEVINEDPEVISNLIVEKISCPEKKNIDANFRIDAQVYFGLTGYNKQIKDHTEIKTHKLPNKEGDYLLCKYGCTKQEIRKREGGGNYSNESMVILNSYSVETIENARIIEGKLKQFIVNCEFTELQGTKNEYFYCKNTFYQNLQHKFPNIIYGKN